MKKNNRGFSLVELMIVVGMLGGVSLLVTNLTQQSTKSSVKFQFDSDVTLTTNEINGILSDPVKCLTTLGSSATPASIVGKYYISTDGSAPANGYGNSGLKVTSYTLTGTAPDGVLTIAYQNKNILKGSSGATTVPKKINIYIEGSPGAITKCRALSTSTIDIWSHVTGTDITYDGNVGVGTTSPTAKLDVAGDIKIGNTTPAATACTAAQGGSTRYNSTLKIMEYCNETGWTAMGGKTLTWLTWAQTLHFPQPISVNDSTSKSLNIATTYPGAKYVILGAIVNRQFPTMPASNWYLYANTDYNTTALWTCTDPGTPVVSNPFYWCPQGPVQVSPVTGNIDMMYSNVAPGGAQVWVVAVGY